MRTTRAAQAAIAIAIAACTAAGVLATTDAAVRLFGVGVGLALAGWLAVRARPVLVGLLVLGTLNAIPFFDVGRRADACVVALAAVLGATLLARGTQWWGHRRLRAAVLWSVAMIGWWLVTWGRSVVTGDVTPARAFFYGRDFLYFAVLLPLLIATLERRDVAPMVATLVAGAALTALGHVAVVATGGPVPALVHTTDIRTDSGVPRIYSAANDLVIALLPIALAAVLLCRAPRIRIAGTLAGAVTFAAVAFLQVRAVYGAFAVALIAVTALVGSRRTPVGTSLRGSAAALVAVLAVATAVVAFARPGPLTGPTVTTVGVRAVSGLAATSESTGTAAYRERLTGSMLRRLGSAWPVGLGFLHPSERYFAGLPEGAIRNTDVGITNALMTMGAVGALLLYLPVLAGLAALLAALGRPVRPGAQPWLAYGVAVWLATALLSSITLVTLFSTSGLVLTATLLAVGLTVV